MPSLDRAMEVFLRLLAEKADATLSRHEATEAFAEGETRRAAILRRLAAGRRKR